MTERNIDLRAAINAVSDVIQNRPRPIREFDQIHMKAGDMVLQSELVANWAKDKRLAFIGDGDAISVCVAYLKARGIVDYGPSRVTVFDFDERIVQAIKRFADKERIDHLDAELYNCVDGLPEDRARFDAFYTNPPWGQYNKGASVNLFMQRGMEAIHYDGQGTVVIADNAELSWTKTVMSEVQKLVLEPRCAFGQHRHQQIGQPNTEDEARDPADCREQNALGQHLPLNARAARAHRGPDRNFPFAARRRGRGGDWLRSRRQSGARIRRRRGARGGTVLPRERAVRGASNQTRPNLCSFRETAGRAAH